MKKTLYKNILALVLGVICAVGVSYVSAGTYTANSGPSYTGQTDTPLNVSTTAQVKTGGLSVYPFTALQNAQFDSTVFFAGILRGDDPLTPSTTSTVQFGGTTAGTNYPATVNLASNLTVGTTTQSSGVAVSSFASTGSHPVCADATGKIILCPVAACPGTMISNGAGGCACPAGTIVGIGADGNATCLDNSCITSLSSNSCTPSTLGSCFIADTQVTLAGGKKINIQDVKIGDTLKGEKTNNTVLGFHRPELGNYKLYSFNGGRTFVTEEHPFKTTAGWKSINPEKTATENIGVKVTKLAVGDMLLTDSGLVKITSIDAHDAKTDTKLYNFILDGDHTYYADGYLVHNKLAATYVPVGTNGCSTTGEHCAVCPSGYAVVGGTCLPIITGTCTSAQVGSACQ